MDIKNREGKLSISFKKIADRVRMQNLPDFDLVIGIATGGIVPASLLAYHLKCDFEVVRVNYRDDNNKPLYEKPLLISPFMAAIPFNTQILIVDDVSVTGFTLDLVKNIFNNYKVKTLVLKGKADYVLFPEISNCVHWPWKFD